MGFRQILNEFQRRRGLGYSYGQCIDAIRDREAGIGELATDDEIELALALLEDNRPMDGGDWS